MITTTLNRIRACNPCATGWSQLLDGLGKRAADDDPLPYADIVRINGIDDALWACRAEPQHGREWRQFAVWCARKVQHLMTDPRSIAALDVADRYANGDATATELDAAWDAAAWDAVAWDAARAAVRAAAWAAARDATWAAAAWAAARDAQTVEFLRIVGEAA